MNFLSNVLDSIPVVGTVKGLVHYATGDTDGGNKAIYQSTRTTAVLAAGAAGCLAGPAGGALAAMSAGAATDALASAAMNEKQGIFQSLDKIKDDIDEGRVPTGSIVSAGLVLGLDGLGGLGMGGISSAASKVSEKAVAKTMENVGKQVATIVGEEVIEKSVGMTAKEIAKIATKKVSEKTIEQVALQAEIVLVSTHIGLNAEKRTQEKRAEEERERRAREERERREREERERRAREEGKNRASEGRKKPPAAGSGSSQPPQGNKNNEKSEEKIEPDYFDILMQLLRELLKLIYGKDPEPFSRIFKKLSEGQVTYLVKVIKNIYNYGSLNEVVELVIRMFKEYFPNISFTNFLSLLEFVQVFISDKFNDIDMIERGAVTIQPKMDKARRKRIINGIVRQYTIDILQQLVDLFEELRDEIEAEISAPNEDTFAAVNHYLKHRLVSDYGLLTVKQYFDWIKENS